MATIQPETDYSPESSDASSNDYDSIYDSESGSVTDTLNSTWYKTCHKFVNGRRYANTGKATQEYLANDESAQEQLDISHLIFSSLVMWESDKNWNPQHPHGLPKNHRAPIGENPQKVLDLGTGTGIWAIEFGDMYSSASVVGLDVTPIQPTYVPANVEFQIEDFTETTTITPNSYDFVFARSMHASFTKDDWTKVLKNVFKILKPGGYFELFYETGRIATDDNSIPKDWKFEEWLEKLKGFQAKRDINMCIDDYIEPMLEEAGFVDVVDKIYKVPIGPWAKDETLKQLGSFFLLNLFIGIEGWSLAAFTQGLGMSEDEARDFNKRVMKELKNKKIHSYMPFHNKYMRKPEDGNPPTSSHQVVQHT